MKGVKQILRCGMVVLWAFTAVIANAGVVINELMPCNISTYRNGNNNYVGWIELYNDGADDVDIKGYTFKNLKKGGDEKWSWTVGHSCVIGADEYVLYYFDEITDQNFHAGYKIDSDGGSLILLSGTTEVSKVSYPIMYPHLSYGYFAGVLGYMEPTPKKGNGASYSSISSRCKQPTFGTAPGVQTSEVSLFISSATAGAQIYYTTNGSEPTMEKGKPYTEPIKISKTRVIRARAYKEGMLSSAMTTGSYLYVDDKHKECGFAAPIVSITTDSVHFYDNTYGIYVTGTNGTTNPNKGCLSTPANYNQDWTRPVHFEYIVDGKPVISQEVEVGVMGGCSRTYAKKTLKLNASKKTGKNKLAYSFFSEKPDNEYKSLQLRNGGNAYETLRVRDGFMQSISSLLNIDHQAYQPVAYYIDGVYAGLMGLRERTNKDFVYSNYGLDEDQIDLLEITEKGNVTASTGTKDAYDDLIKTLKGGTPSSSSYYADAAKFMDMDEYINYQIFEQFIVNTDWPANNTKLWRERNNGRFRWIVYDTDFGLGLYDAGPPNYTGVDVNMIKFSLGEDPKNWANSEEWMVVLYKSLMANEEFRSRFLTKYLHHLKYTFTEDKIDSLWSVISEKAACEYAANKGGADLDNDAKYMIEFAKKRPSVIYKNLKEYYNAGEMVDLSVAIKDDQGGVIPKAEIIMNYQPLGVPDYENKYFSSLTLRVEPKVPVGYAFKEWKFSSDVSKTKKTISLLDNATTWKYYFADSQPEGVWNDKAYDDSNWKVGVGSFGVNSKYYTPNVTLVDGADKHYKASYYRTKFTVDDVNEVDSLLATVVYDDGVVVYLNGKEVKRLNMQDGKITYDVYAPTYTNDQEDKFSIGKSFLVDGENILAVEVHQYDSTSTDMTFALSLSEIYGGTVTTGEVFEGSLTGDMDMVAVYTKVSAPILPTLQLNEICSSNDSKSGNADEYGNYPDWIEIYNYGKDDVDLAGMYLTDNFSDLTKSQFPYGENGNTTVKAGEYKIVWADNTTWRGARHADFKISASGSPLALSCDVQGKTVVLDSVSCKPLAKNASYGRVLDNDEWTVFDVCEKDNLVTYAEKNNDKCEEKVSVEDGYLIERISDGVVVYPNPVRSVLNVRVTDDTYDESLNAYKIRSVSVYDGLGILKKQILVSGETSVAVDVDELVSGIYYLKVITDASSYSATFKKE